jgi:tripartite-type tricarboxylate transporter receptor subunit TctC
MFYLATAPNRTASAANRSRTTNPALASLRWTPQKNVEVVHGSAPGGSNDKRAREIEKALAETKLIPTSMTVASK